MHQITENQEKKAHGPDEFIGEFYKTFTKEIIPVLFQKIKPERILPNTALSHNKNFQLTKNFLNMTRNIYKKKKKATANMALQGKKLDDFPLIGTSYLM